MKNSGWFIIILVILLLGISYQKPDTTFITYTGNTYLVKQDGTGDFTTIQDCVDSISSGDICLVYPGSYGRITINRNLIKIKGLNAPQISFDTSGNAQLDNPNDVATTQGFDVNGDSVTIEGFEITEVGSSSYGIDLNNVDNVEIINNYIHDTNPVYRNYGFGITGNGNNILIKNNVLSRIQGISIILYGNDWVIEGNDISHGNDRSSSGTEIAGDVDAFRFFGTGHIIRGNNIHDFYMSESVGDPHIDCFQTYSTNGEIAQNILIEKNRCYHAGQMFMGEDQTELGGGTNNVHHITFRNNVFNNCWGKAIGVHNVDYLTLVNNVFQESYYSAVIIEDNSHHPIIVNNIFYNVYYSSDYTKRAVVVTADSLTGATFSNNIYYPQTHTNTGETNAIYADPLFVNPSSGEFHLQADSPAIDAGVDLSSLGFSDDIDGVSRPQGSAWDIGVYEYTSIPQDILIIGVDKTISGLTVSWDIEWTGGEPPYIIEIEHAGEYITGIMETSRTVTHTFSSPGTYDGSVCVYDDNPETNNLCVGDTVTVDTGNCNTEADTNCDGVVSRDELGVSITQWINGAITRTKLGEIIVAWVG